MVTDREKRVLILMADAGFGHRSAAQAIEAALIETYGKDAVVNIVNAMDDEHTPSFLRETQTDYDRGVKETPDLYKIGYDASDMSVTATIMESALSLMMLETMRSILERYQPDVIVSVYSYYLAPLNAAFHLTGHRVPVITVVTDLSGVHRLWFHGVSDICVVPTQDSYDLAVKYGLPPRKVKLLGIPVHPRLIREQRSPEEIRAELGWQPDMTTLLVAGSKRVKHLPEMLRALNHSALPLQMALIAGGDDELYQEFTQTEWHMVTHLYNFVDNLSPMIRASDCIASKAGGLIVSESLACGLPILLVDVIEGHESGNAEYVLGSGAGEFAHDSVEALEILYHWLANGGEQLALRAENARMVGHPNAAYDIAKLAWEMADVPVES